MDCIERAPRVAPVYARERWKDIWPEVEPLARQHFEQDNPPGTPRHGLFDLDLEQFSLLDSSGQWLIFTARRAGRLVGYSTWTVLRDLECRGLLIADQGPLFVLPGQASGLVLYRTGLEYMRALGVWSIHPYHRVSGSGARLERYFTLRLGAKAIKIEYEMKL